MIAAIALAAEPIHLHSQNPHYFEFRGKPTILVTSGEHYGAVLNLDFDMPPYLDELKSRGFNLTRTFSAVRGKIGTVVEIGPQNMFVVAQGGQIEVSRVRFDEGKKVSAAQFAGEAGVKVGTVLGD